MILFPVEGNKIQSCIHIGALISILYTFPLSNSKVIQIFLVGGDCDGEHIYHNDLIVGPSK
jgi:hypothetical protein